MKNNNPVAFNFAALAIIPLSAAMAQTFSEQIDALYEAADAPDTPRPRAEALLRLAAKLLARCRRQE